MNHEETHAAALAEFKNALRTLTGRKNAAKLAAAHEAFAAATEAYRLAEDAIIAAALANCTHEWAIDNTCGDCGADITPAKVSEGEQLAFAL